MYHRIYEGFSFPIPLLGQTGRTLRHSRAMSGFAGLSPSRNRKPEDSTLSGYARNSRKECAGLVAGQAALTAENKLVKEIDTEESTRMNFSGLPELSRNLGINCQTFRIGDSRIFGLA